MFDNSVVLVFHVNNVKADEWTDLRSGFAAVGAEVSILNNNVTKAVRIYIICVCVCVCNIDVARLLNRGCSSAILLLIGRWAEGAPLNTSNGAHLFNLVCQIYFDVLKLSPTVRVCTPLIKGAPWNSYEEPWDAVCLDHVRCSFKRAGLAAENVEAEATKVGTVGRQSGR